MIELINVSKTFDNGIEKNHAFKTTDLVIEKGQFVSVVGGNGAGKSTFLSLISGVNKPTTGQILIDGIDVTKMPRHKRATYIASVFQDPNMGVSPELTIAENMAIAYARGTGRHGLSIALKKKHLDIFAEKLATFGRGLEDRLHQKVNLLSGGQRQVVTLMMATLHKPKLLLLDEHTSALDPPISKQVMEVTNEIVTTLGITTIMITHSLSDAIFYGDRLLMFRQGEKAFDLIGAEKSKMTVSDLVTKFE